MGWGKSKGSLWYYKCGRGNHWNANECLNCETQENTWSKAKHNNWKHATKKDWDDGKSYYSESGYGKKDSPERKKLGALRNDLRGAKKLRWDVRVAELMIEIRAQKKFSDAEQGVSKEKQGKLCLDEVDKLNNTRQ